MHQSFCDQGLVIFWLLSWLSYNIKQFRNQKINCGLFYKRLGLLLQNNYWLNSAVLAACGMDGHGFKPWTYTNACGHICKYLDRKGSAAMPTCIQPAGVESEVNLWIKARKHARGAPWLWNPGQTSPEVQNRIISGPTKRTCVLQNFFKKYWIKLFRKIKYFILEYHFHYVVQI